MESRTRKDSTAGPDSTVNSPTLWAVKPSSPSGIRDILQCLGNMPWGVYEKLQCENRKFPLGFWVTTMPAAQENYIPREKLLLIVLWAQVERKHLIMGHRMAIWPELPIMSSSVRCSVS